MPTAATTHPARDEPEVVRWMRFLQGRSNDRWRDMGFAVGPDRCIDATKAWMAMEAAGSLPKDAKDRFARLAPIFCTSHEALALYHQWIPDYLADQNRRMAPPPAPSRPLAPTPRSPSPPWPWILSLAAIVVGTAVIVWLGKPEAAGGGRVDPLSNGPVTLSIQANAIIRYYTGAEPATNSTPGDLDPVHQVKVQAAKGGSRLVTLCCLTAFLLAAWDHVSRRLYLQQGPSLDDAEKALDTKDPKARRRPPRAMANDGRALNRRLTGCRELFDPGATIMATLRAGGAFAPRFRRLPTSPAYLVLLERIHPRDHFTACFKASLAQLADAGVGLDVWLFHGSPGNGCTPWDPLRPEARRGHLIPLRDILEAHPDHRIMVIADPAVAWNPLNDQPRPWLKGLSDRPEKAWISSTPPLPHGRPETLLRSIGFNVLPATPEVFGRMADLFHGAPASRRPRNRPSPGFPVLLRGDPLGWVSRPYPPEPSVRRALLIQLRTSLKPEAFNLLGATAIFPALTPNLTRSLAQVTAPSDPAPDLLQLASLPFHRYAILPPWLRKDLMGSIDRSLSLRLRRHLADCLRPVPPASGQRIGVRLPKPPTRPPTPVLSRLQGVVRALASRLQSRAAAAAWLRDLGTWLMPRPRHAAGDSVLVEFMNPGHLSPLARRLPEPLRATLFPEGVAAHGLRRRWMFALLAIAGVAAWASHDPKHWLPIPAPSIPFRLTTLTTNVAFTNSLGMVFVPVTNAGVWFSAYETRVQDYEAFAKTRTGGDASWRNPDYLGVAVTPGPTHPVVNVSWNDARDFCQWLTATERRAGTLPANRRYRLPTDLEWSAAVGLPREQGATPQERDAKIPDVYPWGTTWPPPVGAGNFADVAWKKALGNELGLNWTFIEGYDDGFATTSPVGSFPASRIGIHDLAGNVWEWCEDWYDTDQKFRVLRGGSWNLGVPRRLLSSCRISVGPVGRYDYLGFRVVLGVDEPAR